MGEIAKLREMIERERHRVDRMILNGTDEEFYQANLRLDRLIEEYIDLENQEKIAGRHRKQ